MSKFHKLILKLLSANSDKNFEFDDLTKLLEQLGFTLRIKGSHHIFTKEGIDEIINLQPINKYAKALSGKTSERNFIKV